MKILKIAAIAVLCGGASGCYATHESMGTAGGAAIGGLVGSQFGGGTSGRLVGALAGVVIGGLIGNRIGAALDRRDRYYHERNAHRAMDYGDTGRRYTWRNPRSGNGGYTRPTSPGFRGPRGRLCRRFEETVVLRNGERRTVRGMRCRNRNGSWEYLG